MKERQQKREQEKLAKKRKYEEDLLKTKPIITGPVSTIVTESALSPVEEGVIKWVSSRIYSLL